MILNDIGVLEFLENANFPHGSARDPFIFVLEPDLFQGHCLVCEGVFGFEYHAVGA